MATSSRKDRRADTGTMAGMAISGASVDVVSRFGTAVKEHLAAYSGIDNDLGREWNRGLKEFSEYKISADPNVDPKRYYAELRAKAGYVAERIEVSRTRAEEAISGKSPTTVRTDDLPGHVNDPLFDITSEVDASGNPVPGSSAQMKFRGKSPAECLDILSGKDCRKYVDSDCKLMVPKDFYDGVKEELAERIKSLKGQVEHLKATGNTEALARREAELAKLETIDRNLVKSKVTTEEAVEGYLNPEVSTAKDIVRVAHRAGVEQLKMGAAIGGGMSLARNLVDVYRGKKTIGEAVKSVAIDTSGAAAGAYGVAFTGAVIKGTAQNSASSYVRTLAKSSLPAYIATATFEIGKTMAQFFSGKIDGAQCVEELGVKGYCMTSSAMYAAIGQVAIPIPIVGAMAGSMLGYFIGSASYRELKDSLKMAKLAREARIRIERECEEAIALVKECRAELQANIDKYLENKKAFFEVTFNSVKECLELGDIDGYIAGTNEMIRHLGGTPQYSSKAEFDALMADPTKPFTL